MLLSSIEYFLFLPIVFLLFWLVFSRSKTTQNVFILFASLFFYSLWDWLFLGLLLLTTISTFMSGVLLERTNVPSRRKFVLWATLILNLGILFVFKYYNFFIQAFSDTVTLFGGHANVSTLRIILPVGISFFTFTALSYTIDVYQKKIEPTRDTWAYFAYTTFFPCLLSGPISRAQKQLPQFFYKRTFDYEKAVESCKFLLMGAIMKTCLADKLGVYVDTVYGNLNSHSGKTLLLTSVFYTIQIYADFAGYSLLAIGSGKLLGIELPTNFIRPYFAKTISDFWRRWHISLTTWFRDYIYYPLGGNRCSKTRWMLNTMIVFVVSGLWHGANYTFLIWGTMHGAFMIIERLVYGEKIKYISNDTSRINIIRWLVTFIIINLSWIFFRLDNLTDVVTVISKIFTNMDSLYINSSVIGHAIPALLLVFFYDWFAEKKNNKQLMLDSSKIWVRWGTYIFLIMFLILFGSFEQTQFIYFQF